MGRHEIRFRRQRMTARRMEQHKNYQEILTRHRSNRKVRVVRLVLYILAFLILMLILLFGLDKIWPEKQNNEPVKTSALHRNLHPTAIYSKKA